MESVLAVMLQQNPTHTAWSLNEINSDRLPRSDGFPDTDFFLLTVPSQRIVPLYFPLPLCQTALHVISLYGCPSSEVSRLLFPRSLAFIFLRREARANANVVIIAFLPILTLPLFLFVQQKTNNSVC